MDLLNGDVRSLYLKYLTAALGSTLIMSIYSIADTITIGQYAGPAGTAAVATVFPLWPIMFAFGLLFGIGGAVLMAQARGAGDDAEGDRYYTVALALSVVVSLVLLVAYNLFVGELLGLFGAEGEVLVLAKSYVMNIARVAPVFVVGQALIPLIRNDGHPVYTTLASVTGGAVNMFGDWFFVFVLDMGVAGAGLATALGQAVAFALLVGYLFREQCRLRIDLAALRAGVTDRAARIVSMGASTFVVDLAMGVMAVVLNTQTLALGGEAALAVWGMISSVSSTTQTLGYATGESAQAIEAANYGARRMDRVRACLKVSSVVAVVLGTAVAVAGLCLPEAIARLYMDVTDEAGHLPALTSGPLGFRQWAARALLHVR